MAEALTPRCPLCDSPPIMVFGGGTQAFCGNDVFADDMPCEEEKPGGGGQDDGGRDGGDDVRLAA